MVVNCHGTEAERVVRRVIATIGKHALELTTVEQQRWFVVRIHDSTVSRCPYLTINTHRRCRALRVHREQGEPKLEACSAKYCYSGRSAEPRSNVA